MNKIYLLFLIFLVPLFILAAVPTLPGTNFSTGSLEGNSVYIYSNKGNGGGRLAIMKKGSPVTARPQNGNSYLSSNVFGNGQEIAPASAMHSKTKMDYRLRKKQ